MIRPDRLAELRAERAAQVRAEAARVAAEAAAAAARAAADAEAQAAEHAARVAAAAAAAPGIALAREIGRRWAAEVLPWSRVQALADERAWTAGRYGPYIFEWVPRSRRLAPELSVRSLEEWSAFLAGVGEIADMVTDTGPSIIRMPPGWPVA